MIAILDYGINNLRSLQNALDRIDVKWETTTEPDHETKLIIPGVGAFGAAMERLRPLKDSLQQMAKSGVPIMGICLGQQLLFSRSEEFGSHEGLDLIAGTVSYIPKVAGLKIPHIGWNKLEILREDIIVSLVPNDSYAYFVHSLVVKPEDSSCVVATTEYGVEFASIVQAGHVWGCQFHPEKSGDIGLEILRNFANC